MCHLNSITGFSASPRRSIYKTGYRPSNTKSKKCARLSGPSIFPLLSLFLMDYHLPPSSQSPLPCSLSFSCSFIHSAKLRKRWLLSLSLFFFLRWLLLIGGKFALKLLLISFILWLVLFNSISMFVDNGQHWNLYCLWPRTLGFLSQLCH